MPELPEVEMVARHLRALVTGRTIAQAKLLWPRTAPELSTRQFAAGLKGARVEAVTRRGKYILVNLHNGRSLLVHLRMTGRFFYLDSRAEAPLHTRAVFHLDNQKKLLFHDVRKFGKLHLVPTRKLHESAQLAPLAPEPFSDEFSLEYLFETLRDSSQQIKLALLDQTKVLGLGNIYAAEALHRAGVNPKLPTRKLSKPRAALLHQEIVNVLNEAIANESTLNTDPEALDASYTGGTYEALTRVYEREGLPCKACGTLIRRIVQGQRSTYFCPQCQRR
ncbi:MAG: bifunctional DNA-formamidopyrimidine glycosylase/DNA-(apurinic or apyrimidinic site) lyase [Acidobacteria bacterium]|nr:bifunctional DNA-formamidopyrimidine glycosylase/DNA-(apurinic or apyrimidinic site) lyase [Acidobacteriota bacterium]MBI3426790.1 bifunctional DNA-formamidopyrimidine glycosylase/DNA-(apurinic or apyrimidinic site) lyase [Acidobacteriota bacterium]